jgi:hypothetical protein
MKRLAILVALITVALAVPATGAAAKRQNKPPKPATTYDVTMTSQGSGLATTCSTGGHIVMDGNPQSVLSGQGVNLEMMVPVVWRRDYNAGWGTAGPALTGCHGLSQSAIDTESFGGALWLSFGQDTVTFGWRYDYYWQFGEVRRGKKTVAVQEVLEFFELTSGELPWTPTELADGTLVGTVNGDFLVTLFTKTAEDGAVHRFEPIGTENLTFDLAITPTP